MHISINKKSYDNNCKIRIFSKLAPEDILNEYWAIYAHFHRIITVYITLPSHSCSPFQNHYKRIPDKTGNNKVNLPLA